VIIARLTGGLGNQLFQYAMGRRLAWHHATELLVDTSNYERDGERRPKDFASFARPLALFEFAVKTRPATAEEIATLQDDFHRATTRDRVVRRLRRIWPQLLRKKSHLVERRYRFQPDALDFPDNVYLQGFWQSPKYFEEIACQLRNELTLVDRECAESARAAVDALRKEHGKVVCLHVRRGDLAHAHEALGRNNITHGAPVTSDYIHTAMGRFDPTCCFFVFSDSPQDIGWCRENIRGNHVEFSTAESYLWDFAAMNACDHHIISNSTFSWWAAWLNSNPNKRVVAPRQWSPPEAKVHMATDDLIAENWEML
jgi:hypothetical protein